MDNQTCSGIIKWYNEDKGYGFVVTTSGDVFVHANQLRKAGISGILVEGDRIRFNIGKGPKGSFATDISKIEADATEPQ